MEVTPYEIMESALNKLAKLTDEEIEASCVLFDKLESEYLAKMVDIEEFALDKLEGEYIVKMIHVLERYNFTTKEALALIVAGLISKGSINL
jgi:hypothetical protein